MEFSTDKQHAHELIDHLSESQVSTAVRFLEFMLLDPVARAVATARMDDESVTDEDQRRLQEGQAWFAERGGKGIPMEEILAEFDTKPDALNSASGDVH